jgi:hypothetical protein
MDCEAAEMLQQIHEHMAILSEDPKIKIPEYVDLCLKSVLFRKALFYVAFLSASCVTTCLLFLLASAGLLTRLSNMQKKEIISPLQSL